MHPRHCDVEERLESLDILPFDANVLTSPWKSFCKISANTLQSSLLHATAILEWHCRKLNKIGGDQKRFCWGSQYVILFQMGNECGHIA